MREICRFEIGGDVFVAGQAIEKSELEEIFRERYRMYVERLKQIPPEACKEGMERDDFDDHSVHFFVKRVGKEGVLGCFRLIDCTKGCLLDKAEFNGFPFKFPSEHPETHKFVHRETTMEASRWIGHPLMMENGTCALISMMLLEVASVWSLENHVQYWVYAIFAKGFDMLRGYGWPLAELLPGDHPYHGSQVRVSILEVGTYPSPKFIVPEFPKRKP